MTSPSAPGPLAQDGPIVLYDGACGLCNRAVAFVLAHEAGPRLRFASRSSPAGLELARRFGVEEQANGSVILIEEWRCSARSTAALRLCRYLHRPWRFGAWLLAVPRPIRDAVYRLIARHRHRLGGGGSCTLSRGVDSKRFLDEE